MQKNVLDTPIEYLKGVGPTKADILKKEISVFVFRDLLFLFPYRYVDKTKFHRIRELSVDSEGESVQLKGILKRIELLGEARKLRLVARLRDETGAVELVWFKGARWMERQLKVETPYVVYGRVNVFNRKLSIPHPEIEVAVPEKLQQNLSFEPVYSSTDKLNTRGLDIKVRRKLIKQILEKITETDIPENIPDYILEKLKLPNRLEAIQQIHFPSTQKEVRLSQNRLKFEELFFLQVRLLQRKNQHKAIKGFTFGNIGAFFNTFYHEKLPFSLTDAQKRVLKEIRRDLGSGVQMNRLLQGDVGSGKTIVGLMVMLMALDNGFQACLMAPTEILAQQHYSGIGEYLEGMDVKVGFLSGSVKGKKRKLLLEELLNGDIDILIGTHAVLEDPVQFKNLGLAITDEQHRFGVKQRARLWKKSKIHPPHVLVMTATPIPRTLAMTLYGDLDVSIIDELPPGRKPIKTLHKTENHRLRVIGFMREQIKLGRQVYVVYPLIEESETLDLQNLEEGYEALSRAFPEYQISIVHGKMKPANKDYEMQRFAKAETQIMVATTVIEVGVNVPNATVMVIENTERFGLSQLHQLRGRVGRGGEQSYCILMSSFKLTTEGRSRIQTMVKTNNGFEIADADLRLRGPGNIEGTQQSGILHLKLADLSKDGRILQTAREIAKRILEDDPLFERPEHLVIKQYMNTEGKKMRGWSRIS